MREKLYVMQTGWRKVEGLGGEGIYSLVSLPLFKETEMALWSHRSSNSSWAVQDLQSSRRKAFLDKFYGEGNWEVIVDLEGSVLNDLDLVEVENVEELKSALTRYRNE